MINDQVETTVRPLRSGIWNCDPDGTACYRWAVFALTDLEKEAGPIPDLTEDDGRSAFEYAEFACMALTGWRAEYRGPGRAFSDEPLMKRYGKKVIVTQRCGHDV